MASSQENVLLSPSMEPLLINFGLSRKRISILYATTTPNHETLRWSAPEFISDTEVCENVETDIWALGMTILVR